MREPVTFESRLAAAFERFAEGAPVDVEPIEVARLAMHGDSRPRAAIRWIDLRTPAWRYAAVLALLLLALAGAVIIARALIHDPLPTVQGEFMLVGPPAREETRQAVPLEDGRVLLFGVGTVQTTGADFGFVDIFDPARGVVARLDDHPVVRRWGPQGIVRLADGRVLATGGWQFDNEGSESDAPAEIIDPESGEITTVGHLVFPRTFHTATLLQDGRVLIAGGGGDDLTKENPPAELFDPATGSFRAIAPLHHNRVYHRATLLEDGRVLITGGYGAELHLTEAEIYDPATESFEVVESPHSRIDHTATLLDDGRVLLVGGTTIGADELVSAGPLASADLFDPRTGSFSETGKLRTERSQHAAVLLEDGRVLIVGGSNGLGEPSTTELYDPAIGSFVRGADTLDRLGPTTAVALPDGHIVVVGERDRLELFDPAPVGRAAPTPGSRGDLAGTVTPIESPAVERYGHTATLLADGRVLVVAGAETDEGTPLDTAELYDPHTGHWSATRSLHKARAYHTAALLTDGRVLVVGGQVPVTEPDGSRTYGALDSAELYDPATGAFTPVGPMTLARSGSGGCCPQVEHFASTVLADGRVLIAGGTDEPGLDLFDPRTNTFTAVPAQCQGDTVLLSDGRVLIGCTRGNIFDPASGQVTAEMNLDTLRQFGKELPNGQILFTDTVGSEPLLFDPANFNPGEPLPWSAVATFNNVLWDRYGIGNNVQTITPLPDGRSLVFASRPDENNHPLETGFAAVFDPNLVTFTEVASPAGRYANTATMLQDGRILFVGKPVRSPDRTDLEPPEAEVLDLGLPR